MADWTEQVRNISSAVAALGIPVVLTMGGWAIQKQLATEGQKKEYVQIALAILREPPSKDNAETEDMRSWAIDVVDRYAPIPLSSQAKDELRRKQLGLDRTTWDLQIRDGYNCRTYLIITDDMESFEECIKRRRAREQREKTGSPQPP